MKEQGFQNKVINATKWSVVTQMIARIIGPLTNIVLARILAPEAFGVVATVTMIVSFAEMFTDSGFQKYLIQHEFKSDRVKFNNANVAFWTNLVLSLIFWLNIYIFRDAIANLVGNPGLGNVVAIASLQLPLTAFSSIQTALFRRDFDFKSLFFARLVTITVPILVTIPLAIMGMSYWALICGNLIMQLSNAVVLTLKSKWKPTLYYNAAILKEMFSFSIWSLIEAISIWFTTWIDTFIIALFFTQYQLGIYKTSTSMVNSIMALVTSAIVPVLFASLSRLQGSSDRFQKLYFKFQRLASMLIFPLGIGVYLYSDFATKVLLGSQWNDAAPIIGLWSLSTAIMTVFGFFSSEAYRAQGKPKLSFFAQSLHLLFLVPVCLVAGKYGFWVFIYARTWARLQFVIVHLIIMRVSVKISIVQTFKNVYPTFISASFMGLFGLFFKNMSESLIWTIVSIPLCMLIYFFVLSFFPQVKNELGQLIAKVLPKKLTKKKNKRRIL